jgi:hypothetical protein
MLQLVLTLVASETGWNHELFIPESDTKNLILDCLNLLAVT